MGTDLLGDLLHSVVLGSIQAFVEEWNKLFFPHHRLDRVESYISELLDNLREAANLDTPNLIQHDWWVDQFVALRAQLEADKEKEETEKRFPWQDQGSQEIESAKKL